MKPPGDIIKLLMKPFVRGTKYEDCQECRERQLLINNRWTRIINFFKKLF